MLYGEFQNNLSNKDFIVIMEKSVDPEIKFITVGILCIMIGMTSVLMISRKQIWMSFIYGFCAIKLLKLEL